MIGNDTPTRPNQIPLPTTSPEFQDAHSDAEAGAQVVRGGDGRAVVLDPGGQ